jgi:phytoene dehydrogenase-like protein
MNFQMYDVVIIGSGIAGLSAAASLASKNLKVLVLEQHQEIGGYISGFQRGGYHFDVGAHHIGGFSKGDVLDRLLRRLGIREQIQVVSSPPLISQFGNERVSIPFSLEQLYYVLVEYDSTHRVAIRKIVRELQDFSNALISSDSKYIYSFFQKWSFISFAEYLESHDLNEKAIGLLSALGPGYAGISAHGSALTMASILASYNQGAYYVLGGAVQLAKLLEKCIRKFGGQVITGAQVERIDIFNQKVNGVWYRLKGEKVRVDTANVLATNSIRHTYKMLTSSPSNSRVLHRLKNWFIAPSVFRLFMGMKSVNSPPFQDFSYFPVWDGRKWESDICYDPARHGQHFPIFLICFPTMVDSSLAPAGRHTMYLTMLTRQQILQQEPDIVDWMRHLIDYILPDFSFEVEQMVLSTPTTMEKFTLNEQGSVFGWLRTPVQSLRANALAPKGAVSGLYIAGQWGANHGVYGGVLSAENAVMKILENI